MTDPQELQDLSNDFATDLATAARLDHKHPKSDIVELRYKIVKNKVPKQDRLKELCKGRLTESGKSKVDAPGKSVNSPVPGVTIDGVEKRRGKLVNNNFSLTDQKALEESFDEQRDGSKYIGFIKREGGKFGSYPVHDNYDDESDAE